MCVHTKVEVRGQLGEWALRLHHVQPGTELTLAGLAASAFTRSLGRSLGRLASPKLGSFCLQLARDLLTKNQEPPQLGLRLLCAHEQ